MQQRAIARKILELSEKYPVIQLTGPRQSGKTTLVRNLFPNYEYKNLENPDQRSYATADPRAFLKLGTGTNMIIDEVQEVPDLVSYIQAEVDENKINSQYIITGSQNFAISETVSQSLAGRVGIFELLPFSYTELKQNQKDFEIQDLLINGMFPNVRANNLKSIDFFRDFTNTYITKDVRSIKNIGDLSTFQRFLELLAGRVGQIMNMSSLSNDVGISVKTVEQWLSVLEASYLIIRLQPFFENTRKRLVKSPKVYFTDTGLVAYLLGINSIGELSKHYAYGALFENFIIIEKLKELYNTRKNERLYFWRDNKGVEIDLIVDKGLQKDLIEIKSSKTYSNDFSKNIELVGTLLQEKYEVKSWVVNMGDYDQDVKGVQIQNWKKYLG